MGTSTGAGCGTHSLRLFFSHCRPCLIRAIARDEKCKEGFMVDELGSDNSLDEVCTRCYFGRRGTSGNPTQENTKFPQSCNLVAACCETPVNLDFRIARGAFRSFPSSNVLQTKCQ